VSDVNEEHDHEGNSPAAWVAVVIMLVAFAIGTLAFWFNLPWLVFAAVGLLIVGALVGLVLKRLGYGVNGPKYAPKPHS
jgi:membrane protein YdbS with pleckstrin-like domain